MRGARGLTISASFDRPALRSPAGPSQRDNSSKTAACWTFGPRTPFQRRVDLGQQTTDPVVDAGDFTGEVVVVADHHLELGQGVIVGVDAAQCVRQRPGGVRDYASVAGVGLRVPGCRSTCA